MTLRKVVPVLVAALLGGFLALIADGLGWSGKTMFLVGVILVVPLTVLSIPIAFTDSATALWREIASRISRGGPTGGVTVGGGAN